VNTSWSSGSFRIPRTRKRVVWGRSDTIPTFDPTKALMRLDLPTFGRPTTATVPERKATGRIIAERAAGVSPPGRCPVTRDRTRPRAARRGARPTPPVPAFGRHRHLRVELEQELPARPQGEAGSSAELVTATCSIAGPRRRRRPTRPPVRRRWPARRTRSPRSRRCARTVLRQDRGADEEVAVRGVCALPSLPRRPDQGVLIHGPAPRSPPASRLRTARSAPWRCAGPGPVRP
jgi:hypothetical protein